MVINTKWKNLIICLLVPLFVGGLSALLTMGAMETFETLQKPALSPPGWLFPVVWTLLFLLMGVASYLIFSSDKSITEIREALKLYGFQLVFNFLWSILFFRFELYWISFFWLILLWIMILLTAIAFYRIKPLAGKLLIPYLLWVAFAGYLNFYIALWN